MKKHKNKIIISVLTLAILVFVFLWGGNAPSLREWDASPSNNIPKAELNIEEKQTQEEKAFDSEVPIETTTPTKQESQPTEYKVNIPEISPPSPDSKITYTEESKTAKTVENKAEHIDEEKPIPVEPEETQIIENTLTCTLSVKCNTILNNMDWLDDNKKVLIPQDGIILPETKVTFYEGESVFNLLVREMKKNKIHLEFMNTPIYNSAYIEGINNIYELDCGELSGWMYKVNGWYPNYGCSSYQLKPDDIVEWVYTCDSGVDVDGYYVGKQIDE